MKRSTEKHKTDLTTKAPSRQEKTPCSSLTKTAFWCLCVLVVNTGRVGAGEDKKGLTAEDIVQKVEESQKKVKDAKMRLEMEMKDTLSGAQQKTRGEVRMKSPDRIFVHYTQPQEQFLYVEGSLSRMYQPDQKTVYEQHNGKGRDAAPVYLGAGKQMRKYARISKVSLFKDSGGEAGLLFIPDDKMEAGFDKMRVVVRKKDWWPIQVEMETPSMNSKARFYDISFNQGLEDSLFQFTPPEGVQVVEGSVF